MATIEIDGKTLDVENGKMIIEAADEAGIYIPRFCYHKKLSIAANCRMCLVEIENSKKPVPACATPVSNGMKVYTKSEEALRSQKAVMEFLLINHPLDCPICDQGGECELQDISMGFGQDQAEYEETKRTVTDQSLGTLISTDMTRCIHCTRCVRFGDEIAGVRELGAINRGEKMAISTYVDHAMTSEISGNIIDLCPVGALTSKPFRYTARAWELTEYPGIAPHDCLGSHVNFHVRRNKLMRVVPLEREDINETWLSDRDRFSYLGLNSQQRASSPMIKKDGQWLTVDWETALKFTAEGISRVIKQHGSEQFSAFASPSSTTEEFYLLQKLMRALGVHNLDHRLCQYDFRDETQMPVMPKNSLHYAEIEKQDTLLLLGCNVHREVPLAGVRIRKAIQANAQVYALNPVDYDYHFDVTGKKIVPPNELPTQIAMLAYALFETDENLPDQVRHLLLGLPVDDATKQLAQRLKQTRSVIITGAICENHPDASLIRGLLHMIQNYFEIKLIQFTAGANTAGAWIAGMLPHRSVAGRPIDEQRGLTVQQAIESKLKGYLLHGVDPGYDFADSHKTRSAMLAAEFVVLVSAFQQESMFDYADVILPYAPYAETSGTYINLDQVWQTTTGAISPHGESRPAWKIFRVLGNLLQCKGFDFRSTADVLAEIQMHARLSTPISYDPVFPDVLPSFTDQLQWFSERPLYRIDPLVRHAQPLQDCQAHEQFAIKMHPTTAEHLQLNDFASVTSGDIEIRLPLERDVRVPEWVIVIMDAMPETSDLGCSFSSITIKR